MEQELIDSQKQFLKHTLNRVDSLLVLRGLACLVVVLHHCDLPRRSLIYKGYDLTWIISPFGAVAVWTFFCLSGYLMGKAFYTGRYTLDIAGVFRFWRNRILRICPLYYFSTLILVIFVYPDILKLENWGYLARTLTFTYSHALPLGVNGVFWSLATEVQFYICVPFIYAYFKFRLSQKRQIILALIYIILLSFILRLAVWIAFYSQFRTNGSYLVKYWEAPMIMNLDIFLFGFLVNAWLIRKKPSPTQGETVTKVHRFRFPELPTKSIAIVLFLALYLFTAHYHYHAKVLTSTTFFILKPLTASIVSFFIWGFKSDVYQEFSCQEKLSLNSILRNPLRLLEIGGILSYGVYVWHESIISKISDVFTSEIPIEAFYARLTATLILSLLLATVTYYLVELPAAKWKIYRQAQIE